MSPHDAVLGAFAELWSALAVRLPALADELRPPEAFDVPWRDRPGAEQVLALWSLTSGQKHGMLGALGGLRLLGPTDSEAERAKWRELTGGDDLDAVAQPDWDESDSLDPEAVRGVYFANGWIPLLVEPLEANYLAVDLVPLPGGHAGQIVLCGRDEDAKCVVARDVATLLRALVVECHSGRWQLRTVDTSRGPELYLEREGGRLLSDCRDRGFPQRAIS